MPYDYESNASAIYRQSFQIIRREADLARFTPAEEPVVVRMIHALGLIDLARHVQFSPDMAIHARTALQQGAAIFCDVRMVAEGITRSRLPANNQIICTLSDPATAQIASQKNTTRSAAAVELWQDQLAGSIIAIGNAPTALFHLLAMLEDPACPRPAAIIGCPVGFVGASESKQALSANMPAPYMPIPYMTVHGRLGGSAITVAAINALASPKEI